MKSSAFRSFVFGGLVLLPSTVFCQQIERPIAEQSPALASPEAFRCALDYGTATQCLQRVGTFSQQNTSTESTERTQHAVTLLLQTSQREQANEVITRFVESHPRGAHSTQREAWIMIEASTQQCTEQSLRRLGTARLAALRDCEEELHQRLDAMGNDVAPDVRVAALTLRAKLLRSTRQTQAAWREYREAVRAWDQVVTFELNADGTTRSIHAGPDHRGNEVPLRLPDPEDELHRVEDRARAETILESVRGLDRQVADLTSAVNHLQYCLTHPRAHDCHEFWEGQPQHDPLGIPFVIISPFEGVNELSNAGLQTRANPLRESLSDEAWTRGNTASSQAWLALGTMLIEEYSVVFSVPHYNGPQERAAFDLWYQWEYAPRVSLLERTIDEHAMPYFQRAIAAHVPETELPATLHLAEMFTQLARVIHNAPTPPRSNLEELYPATN